GRQITQEQNALQWCVIAGLAALDYDACASPCRSLCRVHDWHLRLLGCCHGRRSEVGIVAVPLRRNRQTLAQRKSRPVSQRGNFRNIGTPAASATFRRRATHDLDTFAEETTNHSSQLGDGNFFLCPYVVNVQMRSASKHRHQTVDEIIDEDKRPRLRAG